MTNESFRDIYAGRLVKDWIMHLRKCKTRDTLDQVAESIQKHITGADLERFQSAYDHRLAELAANRLFDKVPAHVWRLVK